MKPIMINMEDMSDSKIIYESSPKKLIVLFVYLMLAITVITVIWMGVSPMDVVINANGCIMADREQSYHTEIYISEFDYGKVKAGQEVKSEIAAYPANEYGYFDGQIESVSKTPVMDQGGGTFYMVRVSFDPNTVKDSDGQPLELAEGLSCRASITTEKTTILKYFLQYIFA